NEVLAQLEDPPTSRPWIQDFEAPWLYNDSVKTYGKEEVEAQIKALNEQGIEEFLVWNPSNAYTKNVNYIPYNNWGKIYNINMIENDFHFMRKNKRKKVTIFYKTCFK